jgi:hypothetical protein
MSISSEDFFPYQQDRPRSHSREKTYNIYTLSSSSPPQINYPRNDYQTYLNPFRNNSNNFKINPTKNKEIPERAPP